MSCTSPIIALDLGVINGKRKIKILPQRVDLYSKSTLSTRYNTNQLLYLPCGQCLSCKIARAKEWAVRCVLEAKTSNDNYFITLTYDNNNCPSKLNKKDVQDFIKRLRNYFPQVRYLACGEYGGQTKRPHYHIILFNTPFSDLRFHSKAAQGFYFTSKLLNDLWPFGFTLVGEFTYASAAYVARYTVNKIDSKSDEFILMSLKPGLGAKYFEQHYKNIYEVDKVYGTFGNSHYAKPPRYFDKLLERLDVELFQDIKAKRIRSGEFDSIDYLIKHQLDEYEKQFLNKEKINDLKLSKYYERRL